MSKLMICEKPSVAQSVGKVLDAVKRCDGYLESGGYLVSWCVGHLVELAYQEAYGETYAKWRLEDLPILPEKVAVSGVRLHKKAIPDFEGVDKTGGCHLHREGHRSAIYPERLHRLLRRNT